MNSVFKILSLFDSYPFLHLKKLIADFNSAYVVGGEKLTTFLKDRVFSKKISLHEHVPLSKRLTFAKESSNEKPTEGFKMRATEMEQNALRTVISLVEDSQLVNLSELLEHRVIDDGLIQLQWYLLKNSEEQAY